MIQSEDTPCSIGQKPRSRQISYRTDKGCSVSGGRGALYASDRVIPTRSAQPARSVYVYVATHGGVTGLLGGELVGIAITVNITVANDSEVSGVGGDEVGTTDVAVRVPAEGVEAGAGGPGTLRLVIPAQ